MAATIHTTTMSLPDLLRAQLAALELMYKAERTCAGARRILDIIHEKRDALAAAEMVQRWVA